VSNKMISQSESPGELAAATGANQLICDVTEYYSTNFSPPMALCLSIVKCDPHDTLLIMERALSDLTMGQPIPMLMSVMWDARWWADWASPAELKAYALACYTCLSAKDQAAFLAYVQKGAAA